MKLINDIIASIDNEPNRWKWSRYTFDRDDGLSIWRVNMPILNVEIYSPFQVSLPLSAKFRIWRAMRRHKKALSLEAYMHGRAW